MTQLFKQAKAWLETRWKNASLRDESGAVSVDWVVLTAGIVGVAALAVAQISDATDSLSGKVKDSLSTKPVD